MVIDLIEFCRNIKSTAVQQNRITMIYIGAKELRVLTISFFISFNFKSGTLQISL